MAHPAEKPISELHTQLLDVWTQQRWEQLRCPILLGLSESSGLDLLWLETWVLALRFAQGWLNNQWRNNTWQYYRFLSAVNHIAVGLQLLLWVLLFWNKPMRWERALWKKYSISPVLLIALGSPTIKTYSSISCCLEWPHKTYSGGKFRGKRKLTYIPRNTLKAFSNKCSNIWRQWVWDKRGPVKCFAHNCVPEHWEILWGTSRHMVSKHIVHVNKASLFTFRWSAAVKLIMGEYKC